MVASFSGGSCPLWTSHISSPLVPVWHILPDIYLVPITLDSGGVDASQLASPGPSATNPPLEKQDMGQATASVVLLLAPSLTS